jgi:hypothetical protein
VKDEQTKFFNILKPKLIVNRREGFEFINFGRKNHCDFYFSRHDKKSSVAGQR